MSPEHESEQPAEQLADQQLVAGALDGDPGELAELARRFSLLPRLLSQWNARRSEPLTEGELIEHGRKAVVDLWQVVPSYTGAESFDTWLARQSASCMDLEVPEEAPDVLQAALAQPSAPGDTEARDALALYRAEQAIDHTPSAEQRPIWAVIGLLGVIVVFLALSPMSPWQWQPASDAPAQVEVDTPAIVLITPLGVVTEALLFEWSGSKDQPCTLLINDADGNELSQTEDLTELSFMRSETLPAGSYRWRVLPTNSDADLSPSPWSDLKVAAPDEK